MAMAIYTVLLMLSLFLTVNSETCTKIVNGKSVTFCCNNSERKGNECVDCPDGYSSTDGNPCQRCQEGLFGRKCSGKCSSCKETQSYIFGCTDSHQIISTDKTTTESQEILSTTTTHHTEKTTEGTSPTTSRKTSQELSEEEIVLYSIAALSATALISFCSFKFCKALCLKTLNEKEHQESESYTGHSYDYVDESAMMNQIELSRLQNTREVEGATDTNHPNPNPTLQGEICADGGYLQPCSSSVPLTRTSKTSSSSDVSTPEVCKTVPLPFPYMQLDKSKMNVLNYSSPRPAYLELVVDDNATPSGICRDVDGLPCDNVSFMKGKEDTSSTFESDNF